MAGPDTIALTAINFKIRRRYQKIRIRHSLRRSGP